MLDQVRMVGSAALKAAATISVMLLAADAGAAPLVAADYAAYSAKPLMPPRPHPLNTRIPASAETTGLVTKFTTNPPPMGGQQLKVSGQIFIPSFTYYVPGSRTGANGILYARLETKTYPGGFATISRSEIVSNGAVQVNLNGLSLSGVPSQLNVTLVFNNASTPRSLLVTITQKQVQYDYDNIAMMKPQDLKPTGTQLVPLGGAFIYTVQP